MNKNQSLGAANPRERLVNGLIVLAQVIIAGAAIIAIIWAGIWLTTIPSQAQESWLPRNSCEWANSCQRQRYRAYDERRQYVRQRHYRPAAPNVRYYLPPHEIHEDRRGDRYGRECRDVRRAVGDQHLTVDGAKKAANDAWAGTVRFHLGEKYMDLSNARHVIYTCSRSSIKEGGVTTLGQTLTRCEIEGQPCHPRREREER